MDQERINALADEAFDHLVNGRNRLALNCAIKAYQVNPNDADVQICYAWASLENGETSKAIEHANRAVELKPNSIRARLYKGYLLSKLSIFEGALSDINYSLDRQKDLLSWSYFAQCRAFAGNGEFEKAINACNKALLLLCSVSNEIEKAKEFLELAKKIKKDNNFNIRKAKGYLKSGEEANKNKDYWFGLFIAGIILEHKKYEPLWKNAHRIQIESMLHLYQYRPALAKVKEIKELFKNDHDFEQLYKKITTLAGKDSSLTKSDSKDDGKLSGDNKTSISSDQEFYSKNSNLKIFSIKSYNIVEDKTLSKRKYYTSFKLTDIKSLGAEIVFENLNYKIKDVKLKGHSIWSINDFEISKKTFELCIKSDWDSVIFVQSLAPQTIENIKEGICKLEIYVDNFKVGVKEIKIGDSYQVDEKKIIAPPKRRAVERPVQQRETKISHSHQKNLGQLLRELDNFIGLPEIKDGIKNLVNYLKFQSEREKHGLKATDDIVINSIFLGNPGTGKTTIARLIGDIFNSMGILESGHVIEVDRADLVGQYIGETAQKTDAKIKEAMGGVLFIDEAYTLVKKGDSSQDFGKEAIDILLKRMEDYKGKFAVIAAGYPEEMKSFLESNPGLKSRFTHYFNFNDYSPDELFQIYNKKLRDDEFTITEDAEKVLVKELNKIYRERDKTFGNARTVHKLFDKSKLNLSNRVLSLNEIDRSKETYYTITVDDITKCFDKVEKVNHRIAIDEDMLNKSLSELDNIIGLENVKKGISGLINSIKVSQLRKERGLNIMDKNLHSVFVGNPGTGKTTIARLISKIYKDMGILEKGHLIEVDRSDLVAGYQGQTAIKTDKIIHDALGGTLFIDEAYTLSKGENDFGHEAIETLLKRMEDYRNQFIVIVAGYTNEMRNFIDSNPGLNSRFDNFFLFEDYTPRQLLEIAVKIANENGYKMDEGALQLFMEYFTSAYNNRDKNFGNARTARSLLYKAISNQEERIADIADLTNEDLLTITVNDVKDIRF
ncbi:MAG: AAA family ATPase [Melioribacteraceae bacterium]|nr:AAA family ATPase [Melioribacteraceae bacterium]